MNAFAIAEPQNAVNDLHDLEDRIDFVPIGIDDRLRPSIHREARLFRTRNGLINADVLVGHFGLVVNDGKFIREIVQAFCDFVSLRKSSPSAPRLFFLLSGKRLDEELSRDILEIFDRFKIGDRLLISNPDEEDKFDAEMTACQAIFCFRKQNRGQLSHIFVRALSLGKPIFVNTGSGYSIDNRSTVNERDLASSLKAAFEIIAYDTHALQALGRKSRKIYDQRYRMETSMALLLDRTTNG
jgi:hypothetical protein